MLLGLMGIAVIPASALASFAPASSAPEPLAPLDREALAERFLRKIPDTNSEMVWSLMRSGIINGEVQAYPGKWLRKADWIRANQTAGNWW